MDEKKTRSVSLEEADRMSGGSVVAPRPDRKEEGKEPVEPLLKGPVPVISLNPGPQGSPE